MTSKWKEEKECGRRGRNEEEEKRRDEEVEWTRTDEEGRRG